jgi:hypothetical protein
MVPPIGRDEVVVELPVVVVDDVDDELQPASKPTVATPKANAAKLVLRSRRIHLL